MVDGRGIRILGSQLATLGGHEPGANFFRYCQVKDVLDVYDYELFEQVVFEHPMLFQHQV